MYLIKKTWLKIHLDTILKTRAMILPAMVLGIEKVLASSLFLLKLNLTNNIVSVFQSSKKNLFWFLGNSQKNTTTRGESFDPSENKSEDGNESLTETPSTQSAISRVKQAKHAAISKAITEGLTKEEIEEEKRFVLLIIWLQAWFWDKAKKFRKKVNFKNTIFSFQDSVRTTGKDLFVIGG